MLIPHYYQTDCITAAKKARSQGRNKALVVMASGLGKTVTVALDVKEWCMSHPGEKVLYMCHQNYILEQAHATFEALIGGDSKLYGFYHGHVKDRKARFLFASFQTMRESMKRFKQNEFGYIVVDESHHAQADTYQSIIKYFSPKFLLGITATPDRADMRDIREQFGGKEIYSLPFETALAQGLLTPVDYRLVTDEIINLGEIHNPYRMTVKELNKKIFVPRRDEEIAKIIGEKIGNIADPKVMIFCPSIRYAEMLHAHIPYSLPVHSKLSAGEQRTRVEYFRNGTVKTVLVVDKFNEGVDIPEVNVVAFLRSTQSSNIFHQQLGRGLRKIPGKGKVLVLDFVANCERIEMVHKLMEKVKQERGGEEKRSGSVAKEHLTVDIGEFNFTETAKNVLDILQRIRGGYTREVLISQLQTEAKRLGKTPTAQNILQASREGRIVYPTTYQRAFGSWNKALEAAGLEPAWIRRPSYDNETLIKQLQVEAKRLGRTPTHQDILQASREGKLAGPSTYQRAFGSCRKATKAAGLKPACVRRPSYDNETLIKQLQAEAKRLGRTPTSQDIVRASQIGRTASPRTYHRAFGNWIEALKAAGLLRKK